jgi:hypothetical protein
VENACVTVSGVAGCLIQDKLDGDLHFRLLPDPPSAQYMTAGNAVWTCGDNRPRLVVEIIPQHCGPPQPANCADLGGFTSPGAPANGRHVTVRGALVLDKSGNSGFMGAKTAWAEIHPASFVG